MCGDERATASCASRVTPRRDRILSPSIFGRNTRCQGLGIHGPESIGIIVRIQFSVGICFHAESSSSFQKICVRT